MNENELSEIIIGCAIEVHKVLGPGLLETTYHKALTYELKLNHLIIEEEKEIAVIYKGIKFDNSFRADIVVNNLVIIELKSVKHLEEVHFKQLLTYIRLSNMKLGLLINFNESLLKNGIKRVINGII